MIAEIRDYFRAQISEVDSDLVENDSAFYNGDIGESLIDRSYQISMNNISTYLRNSHREQTIRATVSIFGFGYTEEVINYDLLLDKAICIRDHIIDLNNFSKVGTIINLTSDSIAASRLPTNDNGFKIDINFTLFSAYSLEV